MGSYPVTLVANSVHRHDQSIGLGIYDSNTDDLTEMRRRSVLLLTHVTSCL